MKLSGQLRLWEIDVSDLEVCNVMHLNAVKFHLNANCSFGDLFRQYQLAVCALLPAASITDFQTNKACQSYI